MAVGMDVPQVKNNKANSLHERALRLVYKDRQSPYEELLIRDNQ